MGFELTFRLAKTPGQEQAPGWPFTMMNEMAKHVRGNSVLLQPGDRVDFRRPVTGFPDVEAAPETPLTVLALTADSQLGQIDTPNGTVAFLQLVGVTAAEKERMVATSTADVLAERAATSPLLVTTP